MIKAGVSLTYNCRLTNYKQMESPQESPQLIRAYIKWMHYTLTASLALPIACVLCTLSMFMSNSPIYIGLSVVGVLLLAFVLHRWIAILLKKSANFIDAHSELEVDFLERIPQKWLPGAILSSAVLSLFAELVMIRWLATMWHLFAFYKNLTMLACFAGLGIGFSIANQRRIPLICSLPLFAFQTLLMTCLCYALPPGLTRSIWANPVPETFAMGILPASQIQEFFALYIFMAVTICLTSLTFIPIGQLCGKLMTRIDNPLRAYGFNLLGSLLGVILITVASMLCTPPPVWFIIIAFLTLIFLTYNRQALIVSGAATLLMLTILTWPVAFGSERIYSPYQLIERVVGPGFVPMLFTGGAFYLTICDFTPAAVKAYPDRAALNQYYNLPFKLKPNAERIAIVGAGSGNDVAAALRGNAQHVEAVEIDPIIQKFGAMLHPEQPFEDKRVHVTIDDARAFLRTTKDKFDVIVFSVIDSHTLTSQNSSLRLDSYIYTTESLRDARKALKDDGIVCLSFCAMNPQIAKKIYLMMYDAFDHHPPLCIQNTSYTFIQSKNGDFKLPDEVLKSGFYNDVRPILEDPKLDAEASTDDWPFLYMPKRIYPFSYFPMFGLVLLLSLGMIRSFQAVKVTKASAPFFFLGAGFMLIETKAITELGLNFGNTWSVVAIVIAAIMVMAFLSNLLVAKTNFNNIMLAFILLLASIGLGLGIASSGGYASTAVGKIENIAVLTLPVLFSGIIFSALLNKYKDIGSAMAVNLIGAMLGGLLEYNSMYFGYKALYFFALIIYGLAFLTCFIFPKKAAE